jgi:hypothetical protein
MLVGYMRVSTDGDRQVLDLQRDALLAAGVDQRHLFEDRSSGAAATALVWPAPWRSFGLGTVWWFGSWTGLVDRFRIF